MADLTVTAPLGRAARPSFRRPSRRASDWRPSSLRASFPRKSAAERGGAHEEFRRDAQQSAVLGHGEHAGGAVSTEPSEQDSKPWWQKLDDFPVGSEEDAMDHFMASAEMIQLEGHCQRALDRRVPLQRLGEAPGLSGEELEGLLRMQQHVADFLSLRSQCRERALVTARLRRHMRARKPRSLQYNSTDSDSSDGEPEEATERGGSPILSPELTAVETHPLRSPEPDQDLLGTSHSSFGSQYTRGRVSPVLPMISNKGGKRLLRGSLRFSGSSIGEQPSSLKSARRPSAAPNLQRLGKAIVQGRES